MPVSLKKLIMLTILALTSLNCFSQKDTSNIKTDTTKVVLTQQVAKLVVKDLVRDIKETFPEVVPLINKWWKESSDFEYIDNEVEREKVFQESQETTGAEHRSVQAPEGSVA